MSRNITIQEGGSAVQLTVDKLKTDQVGGGSVRWVPEDEVSLGTKHITENGEYSAAADDKYGYSVVTVNVPGGAGGPPGGEGSSIIGINPEDGEEYVVSIDENGEIVSQMMPLAIEITTLPSDLDYTDGEAIDFTGIVVKLKKHDGTVYTDENYPDGVIPFAELTFPVTVADYEGGGGSGYSSDLNTSPLSQPIEAGSIRVQRGWKSHGNDMLQEITIPGNNICYGEIDGGSFSYLIASDSQASIAGRSTVTNLTSGEVVSDEAYTVTPSISATFHNKTVYYARGKDDFPSAENVLLEPLATGDFYTQHTNIAAIAWTIFYGDESQITSSQTIPVQWTPPASKFPSQKTRSTAYEINVTAESDATGGTTVDNEGFSGNEGNF